MATRYFITTSANFEYLSSPDTRAAGDIYASVFIDGAPVPDKVVALGAGIAENEYAVGQYKYDIVDLEISSTGTITVDWYAHEYTSGNEMDDFPLTTTPTPETTTSTPMTVSTSSPLEAATGVSTRDQITITFSEALQQTTMEEHRILLRVKGTTVTLAKNAWVSTVDNTTLIVKPQKQLQENVAFELLIPNDALYAASGAQLAADYTLSFTTTGDTFDTVEEATDEGVIERAAPLLVATATSTTESTAVTVSSTSPINNGYNFTGSEITFTFSGPVDAYTATATLDFSPLFGLNELYATGTGSSLTLWQLLTEPTFPTVDEITFSGNTVTVTLTDTPPGNALLTVTLSGVDSFDTDTYTLLTAAQAGTTADLAASFNSSGGSGGTGQFTGAPTSIDGITLSDSDRILVKNQSTASENGLYVAVDAAGGIWDRASDMDASAEVLNGSYVYIEGGTVNADKRFYISSTDPHVLNTDDIDWTEVTFPVDEADDASITFSTALYPYWVGVPEVRNLIRGYISSDLTDADIAHLITNVGINMWYVYGDASKHLQRCVIASESALQLFDDYLTGDGANEAKTLGAFSVRRGPAGGTFSDGPYGRLKDKLEGCKHRLDSKFTGMKTGIKSISNILERPNYRIRGWRFSTVNTTDDDENHRLDRYNSLPGPLDEWT